MTTVINNPSTGETTGGSGMGIVLGVIIGIAIIVAFIAYGLPVMRGTQKSGPTINVPDKVDININR